MGDWGGKNLEPWRGKKKQGTILTDHVIGVLGEMEASVCVLFHQSCLTL